MLGDAPFGYTKKNGRLEINEKEAQEVVKIVEQIVEQPNHGTIGIITTTNEQRDYIEDLYTKKLILKNLLNLKK